MITAVMPTSAVSLRRGMALTAIECFRRQTFPDRRLLILNHGDTPLLAATEARITERLVERPPTLGELRNIAFSHIPAGEWLMSWDDDDWHHPLRMERQWRHVEETKKQACTLACYATIDLVTGKLFVRHAWAGAPSGCCGTILAQVGPERYPPSPRHEDAVFARAYSKGRRSRLAVLHNEPWLYVRTCHTTNTSGRHHILHAAGKDKKPASPEVREIVKAALNDFAAIGNVKVPTI